MSIFGLMTQKVNVYRPIFKDGTVSQEILRYDLVASRIPVNIQPADSKEEFWADERLLQNVHIVYTSDTVTQFHREDILEYGGRQFHVLGIVNGLELSLYRQMTCEEYPEGAKKRLNREAYQ